MKLSDMSRRKFLRYSALGLLGTGVLSGLYAWRIEPHWVSVVSLDLPVAGLPAELDGARLVQISDLHVGPVVSPEFLEAAVSRVAELDPDIVAVTGDWMSCIAGEQVDAAVRFAAKIARGRLATVGILGNHDYGCHWHDEATADRLAKGLGGQGIVVLRNQQTRIRGLTVIGIDDLWSPRFDQREVTRLVSTKEPSLVLCHNPDAVDVPCWGDYGGWILSGHTHGGQCKLPFFRPPILPINNKQYVRGEYDLGDSRRLYVNRGLGYIRRVRFLVRPEVTVFTLRK
jgi:uncharacterized protein